MASEHPENPQFTDRHENRAGREASDAANGSGHEPRNRKKKNPGQKPRTEDAAGSSTLTPTGDDQQRLMIAEAAYFRAEKRGFTDGYSLDDWLVAEAEIKGVQSS